MDHTIRIGGEAGQGVQTIGDTLARVFARTGFHVFTHQDYESRIRGGHNFYQVRISDRAVSASREKIDIIVALDRESISRYEKELTENGIIIYDSGELKQKFDGPQALDVPFTALAEEHGGSKIMGNTVATGAVIGMLGMQPDILFDTLRSAFLKKGEAVVSSNIASAKAGHEHALKHCERCSFLKGSAGRKGQPMMLMAGSEAIALGALASGLKFYSAYPMTPSTGIMNYIAEKEAEYGVIVEQAEDEISAINMALGASFAGVRAMTGTSGGGFALMVEGLSLAGMTETPVVIALAQRPGPATGLPTRTEQADLQFALYSAHGEFPRVVFAPGTPEQAFLLTCKAFDIAEKYQVPAIIMTDQYLADTQWTCERLDLTGAEYRDYRLRGEGMEKLAQYKRHELTPSGVTPMGVPGSSRHLVVTDSDEHDENGHIIEDAATRNRMVEKRLFKKLPLIEKEMAPPVLYGSNDPDIIIAGWGSTYGIMKEAVDILGAGMKIAMLHFSEICPFPWTDDTDFMNLLRKAEVTVCIENNATAQFARFVRAGTGFDFRHKINRYDGRPYLTDELVREIQTLL